MPRTRQPERTRGTREIRVSAPDARSQEVRARVARSVARLRRGHEEDALGWIAAVSEFDEGETR
ncbi:MAG: hypothetical protein F4X99_05115 [Gammaproteobacteria bacterium]|nr:hypothetical protein [Gammaproteobacteria bacterium]